MEALAAQFGEAELIRACAEVLSFPRSTALHPRPELRVAGAWVPAQAAWSAAARFTAEHPGEYAAALLRERLRAMLSHVFTDTEIPLAGPAGFQQGWHSPAWQVRPALVSSGTISRDSLRLKATESPAAEPPALTRCGVRLPGYQARRSPSAACVAGGRRPSGHTAGPSGRADRTKRRF